MLAVTYPFASRWQQANKYNPASREQNPDFSPTKVGKSEGWSIRVNGELYY